MGLKKSESLKDMVKHVWYWTEIIGREKINNLEQVNSKVIKQTLSFDKFNKIN